MPGPFESLGAEFASFAELCAEGTGDSTVTVRSIHPDTGEVLASAECTNAIKRSRRRQRFGVGGGELGSDQCRFVLQAAQIPFAVKQRDQIEQSDGTVWVVDERGAELIAFNTIWTVDVSRKRS